MPDLLPALDPTFPSLELLSALDPTGPSLGLSSSPPDLILVQQPFMQYMFNPEQFDDWRHGLAHPLLILPLLDRVGRVVDGDRVMGAPDGADVATD